MHICVLINYMNRNRAFSSHDNDSFHISVCDGYCVFSLGRKCFVSVMFCNIVNGFLVGAFQVFPFTERVVNYLFLKTVTPNRYRL